MELQPERPNRRLFGNRFREAIELVRNLRGEGLSKRRQEEVMREQIQESTDHLVEEIGLETARDFTWLFYDPKFVDSIRGYKNMDVVEFRNYKQG